MINSFRDFFFLNAMMMQDFSPLKFSITVFSSHLTPSF